MKNDELIISILKNSIELERDRLLVKDSAIARLMDQVEKLKEENARLNDFVCYISDALPDL
jgi:hypothetical protein